MQAQSCSCPQIWIGHHNSYPLKKKNVLIEIIQSLKVQSKLVIIHYYHVLILTLKLPMFFEIQYSLIP